MPGIVGIIGTASAEEKQAALRRMVKCMSHEPFYNSGVESHPQAGLCAGWVARAGSFADGMPVWNDAKNIGLIFAGENFRDPAEVARLCGSHHQSDTSEAGYLIRLYELEGADFFTRLNGWFAGAIIDLRENKVVLFNDRYGLHRIYYAENDSGFYFASEAKALLSVLPELRRLNMASAAEFFSCGCPLRGKTLFTGVSTIPGGSVWTFSPGRKPRRERYFDPSSWENQEPLGADEYYERLRDTFARVVPRYRTGRERVGVSLTGGVDSRMFMAWANAAPGSLPCYTFGGMFRDSIDVKVARKVAAICGQRHQVLPVGREFLEQFPALLEKTVYVTDGAMDVTGVPDLYVNRLAREIAPVRLTGNYGGEILRSIVAFKPGRPDPGMFEPKFGGAVRETAGTYAQELNNKPLSFVVFKQVPWHHYSRLALELSQITLRSPYLDNELVALAFRVPREHATDNYFSLRLIADGNPELGKLGTDRGVFYRSLPVVSRLKNFYQEFTFKAEYAYDYGMPRKLVQFDNALRPLHLERLFLGRHKFYHFRYWYRHALAPYIKEVLLDPRTLGRAYLDGRRVEQMVHEHTEGRGNHTSEIHRLLTMEVVQRRLIEMS